MLTSIAVLFDTCVSEITICHAFLNLFNILYENLEGLPDPYHKSITSLYIVSKVDKYVHTFIITKITNPSALELFLKMLCINICVHIKF